MSAVLETRNLSKRFGGFFASSDVSLSIEQGARHALIGPNGAGKTTLINLLTGFLEPSSGEVFLKGDNVTRLAQHQRVKRGLVRTFQINRLFAEMTVLESVTLSVCERMGLGWKLWRPVGAHTAAIDEAAELLATLLDEPAAGVPTDESRELFETIAQLPREMTILLIEHDMDLVFRFADRISVLVGGALLTEDVPEVIARDPRVREVYLGEPLDD